jgi:hypothetical protein
MSIILFRLVSCENTVPSAIKLLLLTVIVRLYTVLIHRHCYAHSILVFYSHLTQIHCTCWPVTPKIVLGRFHIVDTPT